MYQQIVRNLGLVTLVRSLVLVVIVLLMLTLRFWNNGLISPVIQWFTRSEVGKETVAKRQQADAAVEVEVPQG